MKQTRSLKLLSVQETKHVGIHPNHVWQIDACFKKILNHPMWSCQITDYASGWIYVEYLLEGNMDEALCNALIHVMQKRNYDDLMHGIPKILTTSIQNISTIPQLKSICKSLDINFLNHTSQHHWITEQTHSTTKIIEKDFELHLCTLPSSEIAKINTHARRWRCYFNSTAIHSRHGKTRNNAWKSITTEQLIKPPSLYECWNLATRSAHALPLTSPATQTALLTTNELELIGQYRNCSPETRLKIQKLLADTTKIRTV